MKISQQARLAAAVRQTVKDDHLLTAEDVVQTIAPVLDEMRVVPRALPALIEGIVQSFGDGSKVDPEAVKLLGALSSSFQIGGEPQPASSQWLERVRSKRSAEPEAHQLRGATEGPVWINWVSRLPVVLDAYAASMRGGAKPTTLEASAVFEAVSATEWALRLMNREHADGLNSTGKLGDLMLAIDRAGEAVAKHPEVLDDMLRRYRGRGVGLPYPSRHEFVRIPASSDEMKQTFKRLRRQLGLERRSSND